MLIARNIYLPDAVTAMPSPSSIQNGMQQLFKCLDDWPAAKRFIHARTVAPHAYQSRRCNRMPDKKLSTLLDLCVSSLRRGHANLLCIVPILMDSPRQESNNICIFSFDHVHACVAMFIPCLPWCGFHALKNLLCQVEVFLCDA